SALVAVLLRSLRARPPGPHRRLTPSPDPGLVRRVRFPRSGGIRIRERTVMKKPVSKSFGAVAIALGAGTLLALAPAVAASAHVSASATSTAAGSSTIVTFSVPHGCEGSPTTQV